MVKNIVPAAGPGICKRAVSMVLVLVFLVIGEGLQFVLAPETTHAGASYKSAGSTSSSAKKTKKNVRVYWREVCNFCKNAAFVGSSTQIRRQRWFKTKPKNYMGGPKFFTRKGYSLVSDKRPNPTYCLKYKGKPMRARDIIKASGVDKIFVCMGTNDLKRGIDTTYKNYTRYLLGIRKKNPDLLIFVESTTPIYRPLRGPALTTKKIKALNRKMKKFVNTQNNMYWFDVFTGLADKNGRLRKKWVTLEGFAHTNKKGSAQWTKLTIRNIKKFIRNEKLGIGNDRGKKISNKAVESLEITKWDSKRKKLYFNNGLMVKGIAVYKGKLYAMSSTGVYRERFTKKLRRAARRKQPVKNLIKLLGKPLKKVYQPSCLGAGDDGMLRYKHFDVMTYRPEKGKEQVQDVETRY